MSESKSSHYVHGASPDEQERLSLLNSLLNARSLEEMRIQSGASILDVGFGLGQFAALMARAAGPSGRLVGVERDPDQRARAAANIEAEGVADRVDLRAGDAMDLPLAREEWGAFDIAHTRFLLEHVPDPGAVVRQMSRAVRPGGRLVLADDDHETLRLHPALPSFERLWSAYMRSYEISGNDPLVGRRLVYLLHESGVRPIRNTYIFFGSCAGNADFDSYVRNLAEVIATATDHMASHQLLARAEFDAAIDDLHAWSRLPDAAIWYGMCWAEGVRPGSPDA